MKQISVLVAAGFGLIALNGCSMVTAGIVGAALTPLIQPQVDRALIAIGLDILDPAGTQPVADHDARAVDLVPGFPAP